MRPIEPGRSPAPPEAKNDVTVTRDWIYDLVQSVMASRNANRATEMPHKKGIAVDEPV